MDTEQQLLGLIDFFFLSMYFYLFLLLTAGLSLMFGSFRCFLEGVLCSHDPHLAESTCQTSGQVASSHSTNSRPDIWLVFDVQTGITEVHS